MKYIKKFENHDSYELFITSGDYPKPNVSYCVQENEVHYNPYVPPYQGFCKLTLDDGSVVELEGSGKLTSAMIDSYKSTLVSVEIGKTCTNIGVTAFQDCTSLTSVTIPSSVTSIDEGAFERCSSLTSVTIGSGVTRIGYSAFYLCRGLTSITSLAMTAPTIQNDTFLEVKPLGTLYVPSGSSGYDTWMGTGNYYLGSYGWTKVEQ